MTVTFHSDYVTISSQVISSHQIEVDLHFEVFPTLSSYKIVEKINNFEETPLPFGIELLICMSFFD